MKNLSTDIPYVKIIYTDVCGDNRGYFREVYSKSVFLQRNQAVLDRKQKAYLQLRNKYWYFFEAESEITQSEISPTSISGGQKLTKLSRGHQTPTEL